MTREEAIERMKIIKGDCYIIDDPKDKEAFDMSIFALEQEPYELLIIKSDILLHQEDRKKWIESIKREKENGVIILPPYFTSLLVPNDVEIRIEQPCDDAISRDDAIKAQCEACDICGNTRYTKCQYFMQGCNEVKCLRDLPPVTQKSGKWILLDECANSGYYCSNCQKKLVKEGWSDTVKKIKFCQNCGADMRGEK